MSDSLEFRIKSKVKDKLESEIDEALSNVHERFGFGWPTVKIKGQECRFSEVCDAIRQAYHELYTDGRIEAEYNKLMKLLHDPKEKIDE